MWGTATPLESTNLRAYAPAIAINGNNAIVTYLQSMQGGVEVWARRYTNGSFQAAQTVAAASATVDSTIPPSVTLDNDGTATVVWSSAGSGSVFNVQCNGQTVFDRISEGRFPMYHEIQMRTFRMFLKREHLKESTQQKWDRILAAKGLTWEQVFAK